MISLLTAYTISLAAWGILLSFHLAEKILKQEPMNRYKPKEYYQLITVSFIIAPVVLALTIATFIVVAFKRKK